jgi:beta-galactosidase
VGNGDPSCHEPDKAPTRSLFNGLAQALVQVTGPGGEITLRAEAPGLRPFTLTLRSQ